MVALVMAADLPLYPSVLVDAGRRRSSFDGPVTAQTATDGPEIILSRLSASRWAGLAGIPSRSAGSA
jgi:hypothetical protein